MAVSYEDTVWRRPSSRMRWLRRSQWAAAGLPCAVAALAIGAGAGALPSGAIAGGAVLVALAVLDFFVGRRVRAWGYLERDEDLMVRRGVMFRRVSVVPYGRMQYVDVTAGPFERAFGLATVRLHTAAAATDARIPSLPAAEAARLRDRLAQLGESRLAGL